MSELEGLRVAILVVDGFEQVEMTSPRDALQKAGATVVLASATRGTVRGFHHDEKGDAFEVDATFDDLRPQDFDAVVLPGGVINADRIRMDERARRFVRGMDGAGKPVAVICHGPWLLISAGIVGGRRMTSYETLQDDLRNAGAEWVDQQFVRDRNLVSSRKPDDLPAFNREMVRAIAESRTSWSDMQRAESRERDRA